MSSSTLDNFPAFLLSGNGMKHQKNTKKLIDNHKIPIPILPTSSSRGYESSGPSRELENAHIFVLSSGLTGHQIILDRSGPDPFPCRPCQPFLSIQSAQVKRESGQTKLLCVCVCILRQVIKTTLTTYSGRTHYPATSLLLGKVLKMFWPTHCTEDTHFPSIPLPGGPGLRTS